MYTPTRIAGREAVFEFLRHKLRAYQIIYKDVSAAAAAAPYMIVLCFACHRVSDTRG